MTQVQVNLHGVVAGWPGVGAATELAMIYTNAGNQLFGTTPLANRICGYRQLVSPCHWDLPKNSAKVCCGWR